MEGSAQSIDNSAKGVIIRDTVQLNAASVSSITCSEPSIPWSVADLYFNGHIATSHGSEKQAPADTVAYGDSIEMSVRFRTLCTIFSKIGSDSSVSPLSKMHKAQTKPISVWTDFWYNETRLPRGVFVTGASDTIKPIIYEADGSTWAELYIEVDANEKFYFVANGAPPEGGYADMVFRLRYRNKWGWEEEYYYILGVSQPVLCPVVTISPEELQAGETAAVTVKGRTQDGTLVDYPAGTEFTMSIESGGEMYGRLVGSGGSGAVITSTSPAQFEVNETIALPEGVDSVIVTIRAEPTSGGFGKKGGLQKTAGPACPAEAGRGDVTINVQRFPECGETTPDKNLFQIDVSQHEDNTIKHSATQHLVPPENASFLQIVPCYNSGSDCLSLKVIQVSGQINVIVGTDYPKVVRSPDDLSTKEEIEAALEDFERLEKRLNTVISNIQLVTDNGESMADIDAYNHDRYTSLFGLLNDITYYPIEAYTEHELQHKEDDGTLIRNAYDAAVTKIKDKIGCHSKSEFRNKTIDQIMNDLNYTSVESEFITNLNNGYRSSRNATELRAYTKQQKVLESLIQNLRDKIKTL